MDIQFYKNFIHIVEAGNLSKAAEKLCISQPTLSEQVNKLEEAAGERLIEIGRGKRYLQLTDAGKLFLENIKKICNLDENMYQDIENYRNGGKGFLRLGISSVQAPVVVEQVLGPFHHMYPNICYEIVDSVPQLLEQNLLDNVTEVAISKSPLSMPEKFDILLREREHICAVFLKGKTFFAKNKRQISLRELISCPLCVSKNNSSLFFNIMSQERLTPHIVSCHLQRSTSVAWAMTGEAVAVIPISAQSKRSSRLRYLPIADKRMFTENVLLKVKNKELSAVAKRFVDFYLSMKKG